MGQAIVKCAPDRDLYLIWSSVVDCAVWVGDRAGLHKHLWHEYERQHPESIPKPGSSPDDRIARADRSGTSMIDPPVYGWDDDALLVMEAAPREGHENGYYEIRRDRLAAYAETLLTSDEAAGWALLDYRLYED
jgi:hypothetical protein